MDQSVNIFSGLLGLKALIEPVCSLQRSGYVTAFIGLTGLRFPQIGYFFCQFIVKLFLLLEHLSQLGVIRNPVQPLFQKFRVDLCLYYHFDSKSTFNQFVHSRYDLGFKYSCSIGLDLVLCDHVVF